LAQGYDDNHVWTVVDGEGADQWIIPGFHHINRICYLLTERSHHDAPLEFRVSRGPHTLTAIGLKRRISTLQKLLTAAERESVELAKAGSGS
jgi:hypothetical protein